MTMEVTCNGNKTQHILNFNAAVSLLDRQPSHKNYFFCIEHIRRERKKFRGPETVDKKQIEFNLKLSFKSQITIQKH